MTSMAEAEVERLKAELQRERWLRECLRREGSEPRRVAVRNLVERHGFRLEHQDRPWERPDALGLVRASPYAQLCEGRVIATSDEDQVYAITHELAHGVVGLDDEVAVLRYQAHMLTQLFEGRHG